MNGRKFFKLGGITRRKPKLPKRPVHKGKAVVATLDNGDSRFMSSKEAAMQMGRSKGGRTAQARGTGHRFTSEEARKASRKLWDKKYRVRKSGRRLGRPFALREPVRRPAIREAHQLESRIAPWYGILSSTWWHWVGDRFQPLGERTALRRLGYLPYPRKGQVPLKVVPAPQVRWGRKPGTRLASPLITFNIGTLKRGHK